MKFVFMKHNLIRWWCTCRFEYKIYIQLFSTEMQLLTQTLKMHMMENLLTAEITVFL